MGLSQIKYSQILKKGKIQPSEKEELQKALDLGGGDKVTWFVEDGYSRPSGSQNIIKSSKSVISKIVNGFDGDEIAVNKSGKIGATYKIGRQKVKFMESGGAAATKPVSDHKMTQIQELGSAKVFEYAIKLNSKKYNTVENLKADKNLMKELTDIWVNESNGKLTEVDEEWLVSFHKQQEVLINKISTPRFTEFNQNGGFMKYVTDIVAEFGITQKDNWDPADIWLIEDEAKAIKSIDRILNRGRGRKTDSRLKEFNAMMRVLFNSKKVFGISLKKIGSGKAKIEFYNDTKQSFTDQASMEFKFNYALCKMGTKRDKAGDKTLSSQDTRFVVEQGNGAQHDFQIKSNSSTSFGGLKWEPTSKGASAARLGKATVELVIRAMDDHGLTFDKSNASYPKSAEEFKSQIETYRSMIKDLIRQGVDIEVKDENVAIDNLLLVFTTKPFVANSKLMQITWLYKVMVEMSRSERNDFCSDMIFLAMKVGRGKSDRYGPFAKIY